MESIQDSRVAWVTGAAGFIGAHVAARLEREGWRVVGVDRIAARAGGERIVGSITPSVLDDTARIAGPPALIFHAAGAATVGAAASDPAAGWRDTVGSTEIVLAWLRAHAPGAQFILPSSAAVYGDAGAGALHEDTPLAPISVYGGQKVEAEKLALVASDKGMRVAILRLFSVYGPGLRKQLPWDLSRKLSAKPERLDLFGTGAETRDFFAVSDVADLVAFVARRRDQPPLIVNGGTGIATRIDDFAAAFVAAFGVAPPIAFNGRARAGDPIHLYADVTRLAGIGFRARSGLAQGLRTYVDWLRGLNLK